MRNHLCDNPLSPGWDISWITIHLSYDWNFWYIYIEISSSYALRTDSSYGYRNDSRVDHNRSRYEYIHSISARILIWEVTHLPFCNNLSPWDAWHSPRNIYSSCSRTSFSWSERTKKGHIISTIPKFFLAKGGIFYILGKFYNTTRYDPRQRNPPEIPRILQE